MKKYIPRQIEQVLKKAVKQFPAVALTGPRQSGKSTLLKHSFLETHKYVTFDDPIVRGKAISDPELFMESLGKSAIIDEIQYVPGILSYIKMAIDSDRQKKGAFILTGSQQFAMVKDLGDSLAGRIALFELLPFNLNERSNTSLFKKDESNVSSFLSTCLRGSYPELVVDKAIDSQTWYASYFSTYLERDIKGIYDIGSLRDFERFVQMLASRTAQTLNLSSIAGEIGISVNTAKKWISILEASRIVFLLPPYYENFGKRITKAPKLYFLDCGFVCYLTGITDRKHLLDGPMAGALFETYCVNETVKTFSAKGKKLSLYYLRTNNGLEVDLVIASALRKITPIEIKITKTPRPSMAGSLERLQELFKGKLEIEDPMVVCLKQGESSLAKSVKVRGISHYLEWLNSKL